MIRVGLIGLGKTGSEVAKALLEQENMKLVNVISRPNSEKIGKELGDLIGLPKTGITIDSSDQLEQVIFRTKPDVVVDFSNPEAALKNAAVFSKMKVNLVIGTTGFSKIALKKLYIFTKKYHNGIVYAPNITLGVNVLMLLTSLASSILSNYDFHIREIHHKNKKDIPSGTALKIAKEVENALISSGTPISQQEIPIDSVRAGGVVGRHEVMIIGKEDKIEITHEAFSRKAFALGAIRAVQFIHCRAGYFEMDDVLNLDKILEDHIQSHNNRRSKTRIRGECLNEVDFYNCP